MPVKRAAQAQPNLLLKQARLQRGWSQKTVADLIEAPQAFVISRWENGTAFPGPGYREKLCTLFNKTSQELGLIKSTLAVSVPDPLASSFIYDPAIPLPRPTAHPLVGREQLHKHLEHLLCRRPERHTVALYGLPGVGKTALARELASAPAIREHLCDGILWAGLGPHPDLPALLSHWGTLLGLGEAQRPPFSDTTSWIRTLRFFIGTRRLLIVLDDAWSLEDALASMVGGPHCVYLLTTRLPAVALQCAHTSSIQVPELTLDEGMQLLCHMAPGLAETEPGAIRDLVQAVGGLPLALTLMGNYLLVQSHHRQHRRIQSALESLRQADVRLRLAQPRTNDGDFLTASTPITLQTMIEMSESVLEPAVREALAALVVLPGKPNTFSEPAALALTTGDASILDLLVDRGFIETTGRERYQIHQTIVDSVRSRSPHEPAKARAITFFVTYLKTHTANYAALEQEASNGLWALQLAYEDEQFPALIEGINAFAAFLINRGQFQSAAAHLERARVAAITLDDRTGLAQIWLHLGRLAQQKAQYEQADHAYEQAALLAESCGQTALLCSLLAFRGEVAFLRGAYLQAEAYAWQGVALARQGNHLASLALLLKNLGEVVSSSREVEQGTRYYQEGLEYARRLHDPELMSALLQNLGVMSKREGKYEQAEAYYQEGLLQARTIGHHHRISALLSNLGVLAMQRQHLHQAQGFYEQSLQLARLVGSPIRISSVLQNLGTLETKRGHYQQSERYLQESLEIAQGIGHQWLISETLCASGMLSLEQGNLQAAGTAFEEALGIAELVGMQELIAQAQYGRARVLAAQGRFAEAYAQAISSKNRYEALCDGEARGVAQWLALLPDPARAGNPVQPESS